MFAIIFISDLATTLCCKHTGGIWTAEKCLTCAKWLLGFWVWLVARQLANKIGVWMKLECEWESELFAQYCFILSLAL